LELARFSLFIKPNKLFPEFLRMTSYTDAISCLRACGRGFPKPMSWRARPSTSTVSCVFTKSINWAGIAVKYGMSCQRKLYHSNECILISSRVSVVIASLPAVGRHSEAISKPLTLIIIRLLRRISLPVRSGGLAMTVKAIVIAFRDTFLSFWRTPENKKPSTVSCEGSFNPDSYQEGRHGHSINSETKKAQYNEVLSFV
jgi:hypothetical protein